MTPQEKANELVEKFLSEVRGADRYNYNLEDMNVFIAKQCAKIAVDEILNNNCGTNTDGQQAYEEEIYCDEYFWHDVKSFLN